VLVIEEGIRARGNPRQNFRFAISTYANENVRPSAGNRNRL